MKSLIVISMICQLALISPADAKGFTVIDPSLSGAEEVISGRSSDTSDLNTTEGSNKFEKAKIDTARSRIDTLYNGILNETKELFERSEMRFSNDQEKGIAVENAKLATKYSMMAGEYIHVLDETSHPTDRDYLKTETALRAILKEIQKLN